MGRQHMPNGDVFEVSQDRVDVMSSHRPDPLWLYIDQHGHSHEWFTDGAPAKSYAPSQKYDLPTLEWVKDDPEYTEDGDEIERGHYECKQCREIVDPGFTADTHRMFAAGLMHYLVNGESVSRDEFMRRYREAGGTLGEQ